MAEMLVKAHVDYHFTSKQRRQLRARFEKVKGYELTEEQFWHIMDRILMKQTKLQKIHVSDEQILTV